MEKGYQSAGEAEKERARARGWIIQGRKLIIARYVTGTLGKSVDNMLQI